MPTIPDIVRRRTAFILVNSHHSPIQSRPLVPNVIEVGGLHIVRTDEKATNEWLDYCDVCVQGVVYVSFGSLLKGTSFPDQFLTSMV
ncbi:UDP-glucuronosyl/UDP-glucosyltransferase [Cinara cedri]|uniref:UDP-glucuronosyl/UDP-glucosyltransferase n=1 Tax=Cinara cedri TaxID=506608 RepID=A0A5E4MKW0_9HEMI|nr:UDP-glucuronosyl/UDP-glucosyltransferase [Cinara cedri]